jgi:UDP-glucuronate 4-epimerase
MKIFLTGAAGFIGFHVALRLLNEGHQVLGLDNLNDYYSVDLKRDRLRELGSTPGQLDDSHPYSSEKYAGFQFVTGDLCNRKLLEKLVADFRPDMVVHLAAQAGVRYSITNPDVYIQSNIVGFHNLIEVIRMNRITRFLFASSSSVYGNNAQVPFHEKANVDHPVSLYAATKKSNELIAYTYSHLYGIHAVGLRFFTVYGPWGRPDMAPFLFTEAILKGKAISLFNQGKLKRDFTYVSDVVEGITSVINLPEFPRGYHIYNIGNSQPEDLGVFVELLEKHLGMKANKELLPMQPGDVYQTYADVRELHGLCGYRPRISLDEGLGEFVNWYRSYYKI